MAPEGRKRPGRTPSYTFDQLSTGSFPRVDVVPLTFAHSGQDGAVWTHRTLGPAGGGAGCLVARIYGRTAERAWPWGGAVVPLLFSAAQSVAFTEF